MQEVKEEVKNHKTLERWTALERAWESRFTNTDAILIKDSNDEDSIKLKTLALQSWLFRFEFTNSIMAISKSSLILLANKEKLDLVNHLVDQAKRAGKEVILIERSENNPEKDYEKFLHHVSALKLHKFGVFIREKQHGNFIINFEKEFKKAGLEEVDVSIPFQEFLAVKSQEDIETMTKCAKANCILFHKFVEQIENILDSSKPETHAKITRSLESAIVANRKDLERAGLKVKFLDFPYHPVVQSGKTFDLKIDAESNENQLSQNYILLNMAVKYFEMNTNIFRTLLVDPSLADKQNYGALCKIHDFLIGSIRPGVTCSDVYTKTVDYVKTTYPELVNHLPVNFGFGIGYEFREACLLLNGKNEKGEIKTGNVFMVVTSLKDLKGRKDQIYSMQVSDTILVGENITQVLTESVSKKIEDVGYVLEDEESEKPIPKTKKEPKTAAASKPFELESDSTSNVPMANRTRLAKRMEEINKEQGKQRLMKNHQKELLDIKMEELEERLRSGNFNYKASESTKIVLEKIKAYTPENFPAKLNSRNIHVDLKKQCVLLPVNGILVPFHVSCLKNVTKHSENKMATLRFNFYTPGISAGNITFPSSETYGSQLVYIKELTFRSSNVENFNQIAKDVKEIQKNLKQSISTQAENEGVKLNLTNKLKFLNDIKMRPAMNGRKTIGTLTAYENGFRFTNKSTNENFDLALNNVKHAILQLCDQDMIVILHLVLENPVLINKKASNHVQFYTEVGFLSEDLHDPRKRNRAHDYDEFEEEELERQAREYYNKMFMEFCGYIEKHWKSSLKVDSPYPESSFYGSPFYNNVVIMPTSKCFVSLTEQPFLVISYADIELVSLERIDNKIKNFDMIVIYKDYTRPVQTITNIPKNKLEAVKNWLE